MKTNARLTNAALTILGLAMTGLSIQGVREFHHYIIGFGMVAMLQALLYLVAVWVILNGEMDRSTFAVIVVCAVACRAVCIFSAPHFSTDIYRYVWDGKVQAAGINPYLYIPADSHLAFLRDLAIYPHINRREYAHTIYPPGAQMIFLLITRISTTVVWMKICMVALELSAIPILARLLAALDKPREQVLLYAWHPLLLWEVASSGHVDAAALPLIALALLFCARKQPVRVGLALAGATLIKLYPIAIFPALYRRRDWKMPVTILAVTSAGYACYLSVGTRVLGFLPDYAKEEGMESGSRYFLLTLARHMLRREDLPTTVFYVFAASLLGGLALWAFLRSDDSPLGAVRWSFVLAAALMLLFSSHYPWYYLWLLPFLSVIPYLPMLYFVTACFYLYTTQLANPGPAMYYMFEWLYGTTALLALYSILRGTYERRSFRTNAAGPAAENAALLRKA